MIERPLAVVAVRVRVASWPFAAAGHVVVVTCVVAAAHQVAFDLQACLVFDLQGNPAAQPAKMVCPGLGLGPVAWPAFAPAAVVVTRACGASAAAAVAVPGIEDSLDLVSRYLTGLRQFDVRTLHLLYHLLLSLIGIQMRHSMRCWVTRRSRSASTNALLHCHHRSRL